MTSGFRMNSPKSAGKHPALLETFQPWGNSLNAEPTNAGGKPGRGRSCTSLPPTIRRWQEMITPEQIALGAGR